MTIDKVTISVLEHIEHMDTQAYFHTTNAIYILFDTCVYVIHRFVCHAKQLAYSVVILIDTSRRLYLAVNVAEPQ